MESQASTPVKVLFRKMTGLSTNLVVAAGLVVIALVSIHIFIGVQPSSYVSPLMMFDRFFDLALAAAVALSSIGIGLNVLRRMRWQTDSAIESSIFAFGVGMGLLSLLLLFLGFVRLLYAPVILGILVGGIYSTRSEWRSTLLGLRGDWAGRTPFSRSERLSLIALTFIVLAVLIGALMPPTDVDALGYHLVAPAFFLKAHAVVPAFDNIGVNYPIGVDLLYLFGLATGSDIAAQLVHFSFAVALAAGVFAFGARYLSRNVGILAALVFFCSPVVGLEAGAPILDLGWAFYEFLALFAFFRWRESHQSQDILLVGASIGFALSNKYLAAVGLGVLGCLVLYGSIRSFPFQTMRIVKVLALFTCAAAIVPLAWYIKNYILLGNPVYPFFLGSYGFDGSLHRASGGLESWAGMGLGHDLRALISFPWNIYVNWQYFGAPVNRGGPTLLFLFLPVYLVIPKRNILNWLVLICAMRFAVWWPATQNIRYLLVIFPWLAIICSYAINALLRQLRRPALRFGVGLLAASFVVIGLGLQWGFVLFLREGAIPFLAGQISHETYLTANLLDYPATRFMNEKLPPTARVFAIGDARVYYSQRAIIPDESHANWIELLAMGENAKGIVERLRGMGVTHVWISNGELDYFRKVWKIPAPTEVGAETFDELRAKNLNKVYSDDRDYSIYELHE